MKAPIVEKSTLKGIVIGFAICCFFSLTVFISKAIDFSVYKVNLPARELKQEENWNGLMSGLDNLFTKFKDEDIDKYEFPIGTVVIYGGKGGCPSGWEQWGDGLDGRFLMPLQTADGTALMYGGSETFTILNENLPKHSHRLLYDGESSDGLSADAYLASNNYGNQNYGDYDLKGTSSVANIGKTSEEGGDSTPIEFTPTFAKVLFCIKVSEGEDDDSGEYVVSPQCGTKNGKSGEPTTLAEKCGVGTPSAVTPYNGGYTWKCSNGGLSVDCSSSLSGCPDGQHLNNGLCVADPQCGSKNNQTGEPTTSAEKCSEGTAGSVALSNGAYRWICTNGSQSVSCSSSAGTYTIEFSKRGDSDVMGTMSNLECKVGESCKLTKNQYSKNNYDFVGWSVWTTPTETPDYLDEASVLDIASEGKTKTLYPIWKSNTPSCTPTRTCSNGYADTAPSNGCYRTSYDQNDGCGGKLTCYLIGCDKITGKTGWKCYNDINALSPRQQSSMVAVNGGYCADPSLEGGYYWIEEGYAYNGYCGSSYTTVSSCPYGLVSNGGRYACESYQQGYYCKSSINSCWKCTKLTTEQILNLH